MHSILEAIQQCCSPCREAQHRVMQQAEFVPNGLEGFGRVEF